MTTLYLAIGHGTNPDTHVYEPGAVAPKGTQEHIIASAVVVVADAALGRSGVSRTVEHDSPDHHDPNYIGSVANINGHGYKLAVEIHFDCSVCVIGYAGQYKSAEDLKISKKIQGRFDQMGLLVADNPEVQRDDLYFLNDTDCPSLICEMTAVADAIPTSSLQVMGEAVAAGICDYLGVPYVGEEEDDLSDLKDALEKHGLSLDDLAGTVARDLGKRLEEKTPGEATVPARIDKSSVSDVQAGIDAQRAGKP